MSWFSKKVTKDSEESIEVSSLSSGFELNQEELAEKNHDKKSTSTDIENKNRSMNVVEVEKNEFKLQLIHKLNEIDRNYKRGVLEYKESIQAYNIEIEKLKNQIALESEYCDKEEKNLLMIEHELVFENKAYDKLQVQFSQFINSIEELKYEYKDVLDEVRYESTLKRKEKELLELLDDIEVSELTLLNKELERLNVFECFEPKQVSLKRIKIVLKELEIEKAYFESIGLHKVSSIEVENKNFWKDGTSEIVDTIEIENNK
jgi:hypothetical protein